MRRFADDTTVPISRSRGEIDKLLRQWGASGVQWTDEWDKDRVTLKFAWTSAKNAQQSALTYMARFSVNLPTRKVLEPHAVDGRSGQVSERKLEALLEARGKQEHRLLLLWLKAALNAVDAGIIPAEAIFLPFIEGKDGRTVAEVAIANMPALLQGNADRLLLTGG